MPSLLVHRIFYCAFPACLLILPCSVHTAPAQPVSSQDPEPIAHAQPVSEKDLIEVAQRMFFNLVVLCIDSTALAPILKHSQAFILFFIARIPRFIGLVLKGKFVQSTLNYNRRYIIIGGEGNLFKLGHKVCFTVYQHTGNKGRSFDVAKFGHSQSLFDQIFIQGFPKFLLWGISKTVYIRIGVSPGYALQYLYSKFQRVQLFIRKSTNHYVYFLKEGSICESLLSNLKIHLASSCSSLLSRFPFLGPRRILVIPQKDKHLGFPP